MQYKALLVATFFIAGCSSSIQQRPISSVCNEISSDSTTCSKSSFLTLDSNGASEKSTLAFVEYNEDGVPYDQNNIAAVTTQIKDLAKKSEKSLLLVVFIHGWNHNAAQSDTNVKQFKLFLQTLQKEESTLNVGRPRAVVGVYVGWQGRASEFELLRLLSYRKKKELGLKTGNSVTAVLRELSAIRSDDKNSRLVVVGHSFGGGVLYSAVKQDLLSSLKDNTSTSGAFYGDLIALINPAVEAGQFSEVHAALDKNFPECTPISMISFTSEADTALSNEFPRGMKIFYRDQIHDDERDAYLTTAYGRHEDFSKYQLRPTAGSTVESSLSSSSFKAASKTWIPFRKGQSPFTISGLTLEPRGNIAAKPWEPILNVYVDKTLIQEHNEIWDPKFTYFLRSFIGMNFLKDRPCR